MTVSKTMKAIVIKDKFKIAVEQVPMPVIEKDTDVIIKMRASGLCGSDLHVYRQTDPGTDFIIGHELVGEITEVGPAIKNFKVGDIVASPFASNCGDCFYCNKGYTARCTGAEGYGNAALQGCQAEYVRQPLADSSLFLVPAGMREEAMLLLGDILPTGYSCAYHGRRLLDEDDDRDINAPLDAVAVVIGCGPVGLCCVSSAKTMFKTVFATDPSPARRELAAKHGAIPVAPEELDAAVRAATEGRGADAVLELVGNNAALKVALDIVRPFGAVSSIGMHLKPLDLHGEFLYSKK
jgi:threonine dehydrogenase-like Zn-dependent dehydrogenase